MIGKYTDGTVVMGSDAAVLYEQGGYGRLSRPDNALTLTKEEALYLIGRDKITVEGYEYDEFLAECTKDSEFMRKFHVYRDVRERGFVIQAGPQDFRIFKRGQKPGKGTSFYTMRVLSERDIVVFRKIIEEAETARNMRKQMILAVVDDEDEITYYEIKSSTPSEGKADLSVLTTGSLEGKIFGSSVIINLPKTEEGTAPEKALFGTRYDDMRLSLSPLEALYLTDKGILIPKSGDNQDKPVQILRDEFYRHVLEEDAELPVKVKVYSHLRDLSNIPRTAYKFGHHFRVYSGGTQHSELLVHAVNDDSALPMSVVSRSVRLAHSVRKKMLFAAADTDSIEYIEFARIKL